MRSISATEQTRQWNRQAETDTPQREAHQFTPEPVSHRVPVGQYQVVHIGEDVTVRYFTPISRPGRN
jgi:hypothetical protein